MIFTSTKNFLPKERDEDEEVKFWIFEKCVFLERPESKIDTILGLYLPLTLRSN